MCSSDLLLTAHDLYGSFVCVGVELLGIFLSLIHILLLPVDTVIATAFPEPIDAEIATEVVDSDKIPADKMGLDIEMCIRDRCGTPHWPARQ